MITAGSRSALSSPLLLLRSLPALAWMAAIVYSSDQARPFGRSAAAPLDSLAHFAQYAVLFGLLWLAATSFQWCRNHPTGALIAAAAVSILFAGSDELHQVFVRGRSGSATDLGVDIAGVIASAAFLKFTGAVQHSIWNAYAKRKSGGCGHLSSRVQSSKPDSPSAGGRAQ